METRKKRKIRRKRERKSKKGTNGGRFYGKGKRMEKQGEVP